jgi:hypothetical protein
MTELFGWMTPGQVKVFPLAQRAEAIAWAAGSGGAKSETTDRSA